MDTKQTKAEEIAESFINGNISWVKEQLKGKTTLTLNVLCVLEEIGDKNVLELFKRIAQN